MAQVYSTAQAAKLTGISEGSVRTYVRAPQYAGYFSAGANPPAGSPRQLSEHDLTLLAFVREKTAAAVGEPRPDLFQPQQPVVMTEDVLPPAEAKAEAAEETPPEEGKPAAAQEGAASTASRLLEAKRRAQQRKRE